MNKMIKNVLLTTMLLVTTQVFAFDKADSVEKVEKSLQKTDCAKDLNECRYLAAIEYVAFNNACLLSFQDKFHTPLSKEDLEKTRDALENWTAISDLRMQDAVLSNDNVLRIAIQKDLVSYLEKGTADDWSIECTRINFIAQNHNPEEMSEILNKTLNYKAWLKPIREKLQQKFNAAQEKIKLEDSKTTKNPS